MCKMWANNWIENVPILAIALKMTLLTGSKAIYDFLYAKILYGGMEEIKI